jgi:hypothetical protein
MRDCQRAIKDATEKLAAANTELAQEPCFAWRAQEQVKRLTSRVTERTAALACAELHLALFDALHPTGATVR